MEEDPASVDLPPTGVGVDAALRDSAAQELDRGAGVFFEPEAGVDDGPGAQQLDGLPHVRELARRNGNVVGASVQGCRDVEAPTYLCAVVLGHITGNTGRKVGQRYVDVAVLGGFVPPQPGLRRTIRLVVFSCVFREGA